MNQPLSGKVALVAGATRGAGRAFARELAAAGATVYATGRSTTGKRSEIDRSETIEGTAEGVDGDIIPVVCDHLDSAQVAQLVQRVDDEAGRLDILVNNIWGGEYLTQWDTPIWDYDLAKGLHLLNLAIGTHLITSHHALPLLNKGPAGLVVEVTDGADYNDTHFRNNVFYDLAKRGPQRIAYGLAKETAQLGTTVVCLTPGWIRSELMLEHYGVTEDNWRDGKAVDPHFLISETPSFVGRAAAALAADDDRHRFHGQSLTSFDLSQVYGFTDVDGSQPDCWRYLVEVQDPGLPADVTGYR